MEGTMASDMQLTQFIIIYLLNIEAVLTHLPLDKMATISQTIYSDAFHEWKILYFDQNFTEVYP